MLWEKIAYLAQNLKWTEFRSLHPSPLNQCIQSKSKHFSLKLHSNCGSHVCTHVHMAAISGELEGKKWHQTVLSKKEYQWNPLAGKCFETTILSIIILW